MSEKDVHGIVEASSTNHAWIKTQSLFRRPASKIRGKQDAKFDPVIRDFLLFLFIKLGKVLMLLLKVM